MQDLEEQMRVQKKLYSESVEKEASWEVCWFAFRRLPVNRPSSMCTIARQHSVAKAEERAQQAENDRGKVGIRIARVAHSHSRLD